MSLSRETEGTGPMKSGNLPKSSKVPNPAVEDREMRVVKFRRSVSAERSLFCKEKERKTREKKENPLKKEIIQAIYTVIANKITSSAKTFIRNDEKYIDFSLGDREFTINLVEHRKKKE